MIRLALVFLGGVLAGALLLLAAGAAIIRVEANRYLKEHK